MPTSVAVPQTTASRSGRDNGGQAGQEPADLLVAVGGRQRHAQAGGAWRHGRRPDRGHQQTPGQERPRGSDSRGLVAEHHRDDRGRVTRPDPVGQRGEPRPERVPFPGPQHLERGQGRGGGPGRRGGREDERPGPVDDQVHQRARTRDKASRGTEHLRQRADAQNRPARPRRLGAESGVRLVDDQQRVTGRAEPGQFGERRDVAVHGEHGVGDHDRAVRVPQKPGHLPEVAVPVDPDLARGQAAPVDDRGVVQLIGDDRHVRTADNAEDAEIGGEARREQQGPVSALPVRDFSFQFGVHRPGARDEPRGASPGTPAFDRLMSRRPDRRMLGQSEVVIGRERDHLASVKAGDRAAAIQLPDRAPAVSRDDLRSFGPRPAIPAHPHECAISLSSQQR